MPKRVCMIGYTHYRSDARPRREAEALAARGDEVDFLALSPDGERREETVAGVRIIDLPVKRYRGGSGIAYVKSYTAFFAQAMTQLTRRHLKQRYDVVYAHTMPDLVVFAASLVKPLGAQVVLDLHDTMPELYQSKFGLDARHPVIRAISLQERLACSFADRLVCVHEPHKERLIARGVPADKIKVLLNVPDPRVFGQALPPTPRSGPPRLVYHGTIAERLGIDLALRAFARILPRHPGARFDIYGTGDFAPKLHEVIAELALGEAARFHDEHFKVDRIPELIRGATLGVIGNRDDAATRHMLPVKLLEYVYLGIPTVAPSLPVIRHYFEDDEVAFFAPGDVEGMSEAMQRVLANPEAAATMSRGAARFCERYAWEQLKQDLYAVVDG